MKQTNKKGDKNKIGAYGEQIAVTYLQNKGLRVLEVNYLKKWGEIDIVAHETTGNDNIVHFIEVKTVSYETKTKLRQAICDRTWRPEEQVTKHKMKKLQRTIESWLQEHRRYSNIEWQIDIVTVRIVPQETYATVKYIPNVIS